MRVFVLGTGRCGTTTFAEACAHFTNFTSAHESRSRFVGEERFAYPNDHIEVDNRLSWMLGSLADRFDGTDVFYVHLRRDASEVVRSFARRWDDGNRASIIRAFAHGIIQRRPDWPTDDIERVCRFYVEVVTANVSAFLATRPSMEMWLPYLRADFPDFMERIGAIGRLEAIRSTLSEVHNRTTDGY